MATRIRLDAGVISGVVLQSLVPKMKMVTGEMKRACQIISPTDTRDYINSFKTPEPTISGNKVTAQLINDSDHAEGVETGFRKSPVNRHKGPPRSSSTRIYTGIGANVQQRVSVDFTPKIPKILGSRQ